MEMIWAMRTAKQPSRHMTYHDVKEALAEPGCAVCRLASNAVDRYLRGLLHESVNDPGVRERLRASRGFCREHSWQLQHRGDPLSISILWQDILSLDIGDGSDCRAGESRRRRPSCPACEIAAAAEKRYLETLLEHMDAGGLREDYEASGGLCLPHLRTALKQSTGAVRRFLLASESGKLGRLCGELGEIIRKNDYRFLEEPWGSEKDAWIRATRKLAGEPPEE